MALSKEQRDALPASSFASPGKRKLPITDAHHVRLAWSQVGRTGGLTDVERAEARTKIKARAKALGLDTSDWDSIKAMRFEAMALELPDVADHPNRMPFSGVLVKLDEPSDAAPHGSKGKKIVMSAAAAEAALPSLLGMGVNITEDFDGHDAQQKIGVITAANIEGSDLRIEGFFYAADFPEEAAFIKDNKDDLGFSFEAQQIFVQNLDVAPLVITACVFTGASCLLKTKAAFTTTSLAAAAAGDIEMTKEELEAILASALAPVTAKITALEEGQTKISDELQASAEVRAKVEPFADRLDEMAAQMEGEGIGADRRSGHARLLRDMGASMRAEAAQGRMPASYYSGMYAAAEDGKADPAAALAAAVEAITKPLMEEIGTMKTKLADGIAAAREGAKEPERKTLPPAITQLLAKAGVTEPEDGKKMSVADLDKVLAGSSMSERLRLKAAFGQAGLIN